MLQITINERNTYSVNKEDGKFVLGDALADCDIQWQPNGLISILHNGKSYTALLEKKDLKAKTMTLRIDGQSYEVSISEPIDQLLSSMGMDLKSMQQVEPIKAPMPGMVLKVLVTPGQQIRKGDGLLILEAMKMENVLKATADATVKAVKVEANTAVEKGAILIELE
jgi:biotin carboxyl carrier protein